VTTVKTPRALAALASALALLGAAVALIPSETHAARRGLAATFTVNSTVDADDAQLGDHNCAAAGGACTLRAAIREADALGGPVNIMLPAGTYTLSLAGANEDAGATGDLDVNATITITGDGSGTTFIDGGGLDRVFDVALNGDLTVSGVTIRNGSADQGGGVRNAGLLTLSKVTISGNTATSQDGGVWNRSTGVLTISDSIVSANTAGSYYGGVGNDNGGTLALIRSLVTGNTAPLAGGGLGIAGNATFTNATIVQNTVTSGGVFATGDGGGVLVSGGGSLTLLNDTITNNVAPGGRGAGVSVEPGSTVKTKNTIFSNNSLNRNCAGTITSQGYNLDSGRTCGFDQAGDLSSTDPQLGSLGNNFGPTPTEAPNAGSPVIDAGTNFGCPTTDGRGAPRPVDGKGTGVKVCDIGAVEYGATSRVRLPILARNAS